MSLHITNQFAKKRGNGKKLLFTVRTVMLEQHVDLVAGDLNGAAWRSRCGSDRRHISIVEEAFANTNLPVPPGTTPLWRPSGVRAEWADVCGFIKPPDSQNEWQVRFHGAFSISAARWVLRRRIKVAAMRCGCISLMLTLEAIARRSTNKPDNYT